MTQYLVAAEADKIQDFIFRASRLREVFGGSNLLSRFCQLYREQPNWLDPKPVRTIVADGGSFRLSYASEEDAERASRQLADLYYQATGCGLSVAKPVQWDGSTQTFGRANPEASRRLRAAKRNRTVEATAHLPYLAFCASTGLEFAADWNNEDGYLSKYTFRKRQERSKERHAFLDEFLALLPGHEPQQNRYLDHAEDADDLGRAGGYDPRNYVAYLVADGNGMGKRFDRIADPDQLNQLSEKMTEVARRSLTTPTKELIKGYPGYNRQLAPVLPLILGGDDIFALLPAPCALSFAYEFCRTFEMEMLGLIQQLRTDFAKRLREQGVAEDELQVNVDQQLSLSPRPTMSAAIVICKASYPFRLAHQRGETLLKKAKQVAKAQNAPWSTVNFEVIVGNDWGGENGTDEFQITQRPYFVTPTAEVAEKYTIPEQPPGLTVQELLKWRYELDALPQKRRTQLREYFEGENLPTTNSNSTNRNRPEGWAAEINELIKRTGTLRNSAPDIAQKLQRALEVLGDGEGKFYWRREGRKYYNALPDLLDSWSFLYDLNHNRKEYEGVVS